jgi:hypothetical protein
LARARCLAAWAGLAPVCGGFALARLCQDRCLAARLAGLCQARQLIGPSYLPGAGPGTQPSAAQSTMQAPGAGAGWTFPGCLDFACRAWSLRGRLGRWHGFAGPAPRCLGWLVCAGPTVLAGRAAPGPAPCLFVYRHGFACPARSFFLWSGFAGRAVAGPAPACGTANSVLTGSGLAGSHWHGNAWPSTWLHWLAGLCRTQCLSHGFCSLRFAGTGACVADWADLVLPGPASGWFALAWLCWARCLAAWLWLGCARPSVLLFW